MKDKVPNWSLLHQKAGDEYQWQVLARLFWEVAFSESGRLAVSNMGSVMLVPCGSPAAGHRMVR